MLGIEKGLGGSQNHHVSEPQSTQNVNVSLCQQLRLPGGAETPLPGVGSQLGIIPAWPRIAWHGDVVVR